MQRVWDIRSAAIRAQCEGFYPEEVLAAWTTGDPSVQFANLVESAFYVATDGDAIVGTGAIDLGSGQVDAVFVDPANMGKGVGSRMMAHLERLAIAKGLASLSLDSTLNAAPFYRKCGFTGDAVGVYESPRGFTLACIPMAKRIERNPAPDRPN